MRVNVTERFAKAARADGRQSPIFYDDEVIGSDCRSAPEGRLWQILLQNSAKLASRDHFCPRLSLSELLSH